MGVGSASLGVRAMSGALMCIVDVYPLPSYHGFRISRNFIKGGYIGDFVGEYIIGGYQEFRFWLIYRSLTNECSLYGALGHSGRVEGKGL